MKFKEVYNLLNSKDIFVRHAVGAMYTAKYFSDRSDTEFEIIAEFISDWYLDGSTAWPDELCGAIKEALYDGELTMYDLDHETSLSIDVLNRKLCEM